MDACMHADLLRANTDQCKQKNKTKKTYWWEGVVGKACRPVACVWTRTGDVNALVLGHAACACRPVACVWTRTGDMFLDTLHVHADGLCADADECKEKKKKLTCRLGKVAMAGQMWMVNAGGVDVDDGGGGACACLACACGRGWGTWTPCVHADGLLVDADEYKEKRKNYLPCNGYRAMSIRLRCVQTCWRVDMDDCEEKKKKSGKEKKGNPTKYKSWMWMVNADGQVVDMGVQMCHVWTRIG